MELGSLQSAQGDRRPNRWQRGDDAGGRCVIFLAIKYEYEPLLLLPIGLGCILSQHTQHGDA